MKFILFVLLLSTSGQFNAEVSVPFYLDEAVREHINSKLPAEVVAWEFEIKRKPRMSDDYEITAIRSAEAKPFPRGSLLMWLDVKKNGQVRSLPFSVNVKTFEYVPIAVRTISPRTQLNNDLVSWQKVETTSLGNAVIPKMEEISAYWSKSNIIEGTIVTFNRIKLTPTVQFGNSVTLISRFNEIEVAMDGTALEDGSVGDMVRVVSEATGKRYRGRVERIGLVILETN